MENFDKEVNKACSTYFGIKGAFLAGGAMTSTFTGNAIKDYDIYFKDKKSLIGALYNAFDDNWFCLAQTERAVTFSDGGTIVQFMTFDFFPKAEDIFKRYDFTCCMGAVDLETKEFFRHQNFLTDIAKRQLIFNHGTDFPLASAMRVNKYKERGFNIDNSEYLKILLAIIFKNAKDWSELSNQVGGQYGECLKIKDDVVFNIDNAIKEFSEKINAQSFEIEKHIFENSYNFEDCINKLCDKKEVDEILKEFK